MDLKKRLDYMVGKTWQYMAHEHTVNGAIMNDEAVIISTDSALLKFTPEEAQKKLGEFKEVSKPRAVRKETAIEVSGKKQLTSLIDELMTNIEMVRKDKGFVVQANSINKSITAVTNLLKLELQFQRQNGVID